MSDGTLSERHVRDVLKCKNVNVQYLQKHLSSDNPLIRRAVARIIGKHGCVQPLLDVALNEEDQTVLREILQAVGERGEGTEAFQRMINSGDALIREAAITMFRRAGKAESLLPLLFDRDDVMVSRVKRYINEQKRKQAADSGAGEPC
jgi:HEAT repeat protein